MTALRKTQLSNQKCDGLDAEQDYCPREFESLFDDDKKEVEMEMSCP